MSNGHRQYGNYDSRANRIAGGILIILISLIAFLSLVNAFGGAGRMISSFLVGVFGYVSYAYALCGMFLGSMITIGKRITLPLNKALKYITLFALGVIIFHIWFSKSIFLGTVSSGSLKYGQYISATYHGETAAGVIGSIIAWPFMKLFTPAYAFLFFILLFAGASILSFYPVLVNKLPYGTKKTKIKKLGKGADNYDLDSNVSNIYPQTVGNSLYVGTYNDRDEQKSKHKKNGNFSLSFPNQDKTADIEDNLTEPAVEENDNDRRKRAKDKLYQKKKDDLSANAKAVFDTPEENIKSSFKPSPNEVFDISPLDENGNPRSFSDRFNLPKNKQEEAEEFQKRYEYILKSDVTSDDIRGAAKRKKNKKTEEVLPETVVDQPTETNNKTDVPDDMPYFIREILYGDKKKDDDVVKPTITDKTEENVKPSVINTDDLKIIKSVNHDESVADKSKETKADTSDQKGSIFSIFGSTPPSKKVEQKVEPNIEKPIVKPAEPKKNDVAPVLDSYQYGYVPNNKINDQPAKKTDDIKLGDFSRFENKSDSVMPTRAEINAVNEPTTRPDKPRQPYAPKEPVEEKPKDSSYSNNFNVGKGAKPISVSQKKSEPKSVAGQISIDQAINEQRQNVPYMAPPIDLLKQTDDTIVSEDFTEKIEALENVFSDFKIDAKVIGVTQGPTFSRFELALPAGISVTTIPKYADDVAMKLKLQGAIRFETPIPGKDAFGVEIANNKRTSVGLRGMLETKEFNTSKNMLTFALGRDIANKNHYCNIDNMPHLLIAGSTGSGKSVCINTLLISLLYRCGPNDLKLILVDPKKVELSLYNGLPHMLVPRVIDDVNSAVNALDYALREMDARFDLFANIGCRNLDEYNAIAKSTPGMLTKPRIVIIFDELADFMAQRKRDVEDRINRIARLARAAGIHLVVATQRPSVDVITGTIKSNLPSRIAFFVKQTSDSMTILGYGGAEKLLGKGDMLFVPQGGDSTRLQCAFVDTPEARNVVKYIKEHNEAYFDPEAQNSIFRVEKDDDEEEREINPAQAYAHAAVGKDGESQQFIDALYMCVKEQKASISRIQRKFGVGYGTAANIVELMEEKGFVSPNRGGNTQREVLISMAEFNERYGARAETTEFDLPED